MNTKEILELLAALSPIISSLILLMLKVPLTNFFNGLSDRRKRELEEIRALETIAEKMDENFKEDFVSIDRKEYYFYIRTGIKAYSESIELYIKFKNSLGSNYSWLAVAAALPFLKVEKGNVVIKIRSYERVFFEFGNWAGIIFIFAGFGILAYFSIYFNQLPTKELMRLSVLILLPILSGFYLFYLLGPLRTALAMRRFLDKGKAPGITGQTGSSDKVSGRIYITAKIDGYFYSLNKENSTLVECFEKRSNGFDKLFEEIDAVVMDGISFIYFISEADDLLNYPKPIFVWGDIDEELPEHVRELVTFIQADSARKVLAELNFRGYYNLLIEGDPVFQSFLKEDLIRILVMVRTKEFLW